jgi:hypothetical protein
MSDLEKEAIPEEENKDTDVYLEQHNSSQS